MSTLRERAEKTASSLSTHSGWLAPGRSERKHPGADMISLFFFRVGGMRLGVYEASSAPTSP